MEDLKGICRNMSGHREGDAKAGVGGEMTYHMPLHYYDS